jgi:spore coat polysaccharide biosynthesis protein SpsF
MTGVFLQVRLDSSRLPRKALLPLGGNTVIEQAMAALSSVKADVFALVTDKESLSELRSLAERWGFEVFPGPRDDVLDRYCLAAKRFGVDHIIRATGDNPLVSGLLANRILEEHLEEGADYSGFLGIPLGTGVEVLKTTSLFRARREAIDIYEREHVSPFLYHRPDQFKIYRPRAPKEFLAPDTRVTLDTEENYQFILDIYDDLYHGRPIEIEELHRYLNQVLPVKGKVC